MSGLRLLGKAGMPCPYCTRTMVAESLKLRPTSDHIRPRSVENKKRKLSNKSGASRLRGRTVVVCSECNFMKADLTLDQFVSALKEKNESLLQAVATNTERIMNIEYLLRIGFDKE